ALQVVAAELDQAVALLGLLDAFGDDLEALVAGKAQQEADEVSRRGVLVDVAHEGHVELDELGSEVGDGAEAGVARAEVVDGDAEPGAAQRLELPADLQEVAQRRALGQLEDD